MRLIDVDELLCDISEAEYHGGMGAVVASTLKRYISRTPTIDPESLRPHGTWNITNKIIENAVCSHCETHFQSYYKDYQYCPRCGAKMEVENSEVD